MFSSGILQIFLALSVHAQMAPHVQGSLEDAQIKSQCRLNTSSLSCSRLTEPLKTAIHLCEAEMQTLRCQNLATEEPEFTGSLKKCDAQEFCADELMPLSLTLKSCRQGWLEGTGEALAPIFEPIISHIDSKNSEVRNCDLACKKKIVQEVGLEKYKNFSDAELSQISALTIILDRNETLARRNLKNLDQPHDPPAKEIEKVSNINEPSWIEARFDAKNKDIRNCNLNCKRVRAVGLKKYREMSDDELDKMSALTITTERDEFLYQQHLKVLSQPVNAKNRALAITSERQFLKGVTDWIDRKTSRLQCLNAETRAEMICWAAAYVIDPFVVKAAATKGFRAAKFILALDKEKQIATAVVVAEAANTKAQVIEVGQNLTERSEVDATVEHRSHDMKILSEETMIGRRIRSMDFPNIPRSMLIAEYEAADGSRFLALEQTLMLKNGEIKKSIRELPVDTLTNAVDANYEVGREFLEKLVKDSDGKSTLVFFDVNNLGFVNKNFKDGLKAGDQYLKSVADAIKKVVGRQAEIFKYGGDEFVLVIHETDPKKIQQILARINNEIHGPGVNQLFQKEKNAQFEQMLHDEDINRLKGVVPYLREGVSVGSSRAGRGEPVDQVVTRGESAAKEKKIEAKEQANINATKYGGKAADPNKNPNLRFVSAAETPIPGFDHSSEPIKITRLDQATGTVAETRVRERFRLGSISLAEFKDESGHRILRLEKYAESSGAKVPLSREVMVNTRTQLIDGSHPSGRSLIEEIAKVSKPADHAVAIGIDIKNFGPVNYFKDGSLAGDKYLVATTKIIEKMQSRLGKTPLSFKINGAKFMLTGTLNPAELKIFERELNFALVHDPGINQIFIDQKNYLISESHLAQTPPAKRNEILQQLKDLEKISPSFDLQGTELRPRDNADTLFNRIFSN